jgi:hypothetical protein
VFVAGAALPVFSILESVSHVPKLKESKISAINIVANVQVLLSKSLLFFVPHLTFEIHL